MVRQPLAAISGVDSKKMGLRSHALSSELLLTFPSVLRGLARDISINPRASYSPLRVGNRNVGGRGTIHHHGFQCSITAPIGACKAPRETTTTKLQNQYYADAVASRAYQQTVNFLSLFACS